MKRILMMVVAMVMILATLATMINFVSAEETEAEVPYVDAVMSVISLDGTLTATHANIVEYIMETPVGDSYLGAAWDQEADKLYFAVSAAFNLVEIKLNVGGAEATVDAVNGVVEGIKGAAAKASEDGRVIEIELPINALVLKHNGANVYTELEMTVKTTKEDSFKGNVIFRNYSAKMAFNNVNQTATPAGGQATVSPDKKATLLDNDTATTDALSRRSGLFWAHGAITTTKNIYIETTLNIKAMPITVPFVDNPTKWQVIPEARLWIAVRHKTDDQLFLDVINTADNGIQLLIQTDASFTPSFEAVTLGKQAGEEFDLGLDWHDDGTLNVFVDGKKIYTTTNTVVKASNLGSATGVLFFDTTRRSPLGVGESIEVEYYNFSISEKIEAYDEEALMALSVEEVVVPVETTTAPETTTTEETTTVADTTKAETTTVADTTVADTAEADSTAADSSAADSAADTTEAEKSGCASSLAGYGITMVLGSAVMAVLATSKKDEEKED